MLKVEWYSVERIPLQGRWCLRNCYY